MRTRMAMPKVLCDNCTNFRDNNIMGAQYVCRKIKQDICQWFLCPEKRSSENIVLNKGNASESGKMKQN